MLLGLAPIIRYTAAYFPVFRERLKEKEMSFQMKLQDDSVGRCFYLRDGKITSKKPKWSAGDVVLIERHAYSSVYIYSEGAFWTVPEGSELVAYDPSAVAKEMTSAWRKTDG